MFQSEPALTRDAGSGSHSGEQAPKVQLHHCAFFGLRGGKCEDRDSVV